MEVVNKRVCGRLLLGAAFFVGGCEIRGNSNAGAQHPSRQPFSTVAPAGPALNPTAEVFRQRSARGQGTAFLLLPSSDQRELVNYQVVDGMAVLEGDILLGPPGRAPWLYGLVGSSGFQKGAVALKKASYRWPGGVIPYVIDATVSANKRNYIAWAISEVGQTALKLRPRSAADRDYVRFVRGNGSCSSYLGRIGGAQPIQVGACGRGSVVHEILHAAGFYHEQSRGDRDDFITVVWDEIERAHHSAFRKRGSRGKDIGPYDYGSVMHYGNRAFSKRGAPTIVVKTPGAVIGQRNGLSALDKAAIAELYGGASGAQIPVPTTQPPLGNSPQQPPQASAGFAGSYASERGELTCQQTGFTVGCTYPGGQLSCAVHGGNRLECGWSGQGQGRASFVRQANGVLKGTWGDGFSANSRGAWTLTPKGGAPTTPAPTKTPQGNPQNPWPWWQFKWPPLGN